MYDCDVSFVRQVKLVFTFDILRQILLILFFLLGGSLSSDS